MGSLKSRVERLEKRLNVCENRQDSSDFYKWGEMFTNMAKDKKAKSGSSDIIETGHLESWHIKVNDEPVTMEIKGVLGKTRVEIFKGSVIIKIFHLEGDIDSRAKTILYRERQFDVEKVIWANVLGEDDVNDVMNEFFRIKSTESLSNTMSDVCNTINDTVSHCAIKRFAKKIDEIRREHTQPEISDKTKAAIKNIEDAQSKFESEINDIIKSFDKDWKVSYQLKQEINLTAATLTLGTTVNVFNAKDSKVVKNAKKMGLLDLWFNKVIR